MKSGAILIQVLIATAVSALLSTALFTAFYQTNRTVGVVDDYINVYGQAALIHKQLEQDISGAMIPFEPPQEEKKSTPSTAPKTAAQKTTSQEKKATSAVTKKQEPPKPIKQIFYGVNKDKNLDVLTFITNNPLRVYWGKQTGKPKPSIARVVYRLQKEKGLPTFTLMRQESAELDFDKFKLNTAKPIKAYELARGIKKLSVEYTAEIPQDDKNAKEKKKKEYKVFKTWDLEQQEKDEQKQKLRKVPHGVKITMTIWDDQRKREREFVFAIPILADVVPLEFKPKVQAQKPQQVQQKTQQQMQKQVQRQLGSRNQILSFGLKR